MEGKREKKRKILPGLEVEELRGELEKAKERIRRLEGQVTWAHKDRDEAYEDLEEEENLSFDLKKKLNRAEAEISALKAELEKFRKWHRDKN